MSAAEIQPIKTQFAVISHQVKCDIQFLEARLVAMRGQRKPNAQVIRTYENMLRSRMEALARLEDEFRKAEQAR